MICLSEATWSHEAPCAGRHTAHTASARGRAAGGSGDGGGGREEGEGGAKGVLAGEGAGKWARPQRTVAHGREALAVGREAHRVHRLHVPRQREQELHRGSLRVCGRRRRGSSGGGGGGGGGAAAAAAAACRGSSLQQAPDLNLVVRARGGKDVQRGVEVDRKEGVVFGPRLRVPRDLEGLCAEGHGVWSRWGRVSKARRICTQLASSGAEFKFANFEVGSRKVVGKAMTMP